MSTRKQHSPITDPSASSLRSARAYGALLREPRDFCPGLHLENFVQQMALKLFKLKMVADDPREDPASFYERQRDIRGLIGARALGIEKQPLELDLSGLLDDSAPTSPV